MSGGISIADSNDREGQVGRGGRDVLTIALPSGRLGDDAVDLLTRCGLQAGRPSRDDRRLVWFSRDGTWRFLMARPADVATYVAGGVADLGIAGKDSLIEAGQDFYELLDLGFGCCRFVLAAPETTARRLAGEPWGDRVIRVATKYPHLAQRFLSERGIKAELVVLRGATELAPATGLADTVIDLVQTGRTLRENGLVEVWEVLSSSARLIASRATYHLRRGEITALADRLRQKVQKGAVAQC